MIPAGTAILNQYTNEVICYTSRDINKTDMCRSGDFERFTEGNDPWLPYSVIDPRCTRPKYNGWFSYGVQIYTENGWGP